MVVRSEVIGEGLGIAGVGADDGTGTVHPYPDSSHKDFSDFLCFLYNLILG